MCGLWWFFKQVFFPNYSVQPTVLSLSMTNKQGPAPAHEELPAQVGQRPSHTHLHSAGRAPLLPEPSSPPPGAFSYPTRKKVILQPRSSTPITPWLLSQRRQSSLRDRPRYLGESPQLLGILPKPCAPEGKMAGKECL